MKISTKLHRISISELVTNSINHRSEQLPQQKYQFTQVFFFFFFSKPNVKEMYFIGNTRNLSSLLRHYDHRMAASLPYCGLITFDHRRLLPANLARSHFPPAPTLAFTSHHYSIWETWGPCFIKMKHRSPTNRFPGRFKIWHVAPQQCCGTACHILRRYRKYNIQSRSFES